jgi:Dolichyl-phosphate-mannose-protein mannosyltransferase
MRFLRSISLNSLLLILTALLFVRFNYIRNNEVNGWNATSWDAFGYYAYLPGTFIYKDIRQLEWLPEIDKKYQVTGGQLYQASKLENGHYTFKYLTGVAILETPFFLIGHVSAKLLNYPMDGFSAPYQYSIIFGAIFWFFIGLVFLRKILLTYFSEKTTALTLILIALASNVIQYVSVDSSMSHAFIFPLYAIVLWLTIRWHEEKKIKTALVIGLICGLAMISRPTEIIILFIPLFWAPDFKSKWELIRKEPKQIIAVAVGIIIGVLPQLLYWKYSTGSFVYEVGSKWVFLNPWFRVLFGFEKGWFVYTPVAILMVLGLFFMKGKPFRTSVIVFSLLNIWIIISWYDWKYGASYSARALTQSYPVMALALASLIEHYWTGYRKYILLAISAFLLYLNLFQIWQYNSGILLYDGMNRNYYAHIYLTSKPDAFDFSMLDTDEYADETDYQSKNSYSEKTLSLLAFDSSQTRAIIQTKISPDCKWLKFACEVQSFDGRESSHYLFRIFRNQKEIKTKLLRLNYPTSYNNAFFPYGCYLDLTNQNADSVSIELFTPDFFRGEIKNIELNELK